LLTATPVRTHCRHSQAHHRLALIALLLGLGCTRPNPAYFPDPPDSGASDRRVNDAPAVDTGIDTTTVDTGVDRGIDRGPDTGTGDTRTDTGKPDVNVDARDAGDAAFVCANPGQCTTRFGAAPCGSWTCPAGICVLNCPNCTDLDGDGYGVGTGCAGPDCDDTDPNILNSAPPRNCPAGAMPQGPVCRPGTQSCTAGVWSACSGQVVPSGEACNNQDDDCDGMADDNLPSFSCGLGACANTVPSCNAGVVTVCAPHAATATDDSLCNGIDDDCDGLVDEDCQAACLHVSPSGDDNTGNGSALAPYQTIPMAISVAATMSLNVCVAGGATCQDHATYTVAAGSTAPLNVFQMANGVSVYGNFESTGWTRCDIAGAAPNPTTTLDVRENGGVRFTNLNKPTTLDGFVVTRNSSCAAPMMVAAVTVNGSTNVQLSNLVVNDSVSAMQAIGVYLISGAKALITHSLIFGGAGTSASYGVRSVNSAPTIRDNCASINGTTGHCTTDCTGTLGMAIGGRIGTATAGTSAAVQLETSPGASVETSTICSAQTSQALGVHITGDATGTVIRGSSISASAGAGSSFGILAEDCVDAAPWIVGNELIQGQGAGRIAGIAAQGRCAPVIDGNALITNGGDSTTTESDGVLCQANMAGEVSRCAVLGNEKIQGLTGTRPMVSAGIACKAGACVRVADNVVNGSSAVNDVYGIWLLKNGTMVERNRITGGCGGQSTVGLLADDSFTRIQNNLITAGSCAGSAISTASPTNVGLRVVGAIDQNEMDVDSNTIDGGGNAGLVSCTSTAVELTSGTNVVLPAPKGIFRNNIMSGGACNAVLTARTDFSEAKASTDPRLFQNNDLNPTGTPAPTLYLDEGTTAKSADMINTLPDITTSGNISQDPKFMSPPTDLHLGPGSLCIGAGTPTGAPATDLDGKSRGTAPSIGAYQ